MPLGDLSQDLLADFYQNRKLAQGPKRLEHREVDHRSLPPLSKRQNWLLRDGADRQKWVYLLPSVEEALLLGAHIEDLLYFQP